MTAQDLSRVHPGSGQYVSKMLSRLIYNVLLPLVQVFSRL